MSEGWGLGWYHKIINGKDFWGHNGEMWGVLTEMFFNKEDKVGIIILTNGGDYYGSWYNDVMAVEDSILNYVYKHISTTGDINFDGQINYSDMDIIIDYLFGICGDIGYSIDSKEEAIQLLNNLVDEVPEVQYNAYLKNLDAAKKHFGTKLNAQLLFNQDSEFFL